MGLGQKSIPGTATMPFWKSLLPSEDQGFFAGQIYLPGFSFSQEIILGISLVLIQKASDRPTLPILLFSFILGPQRHVA